MEPFCATILILVVTNRRVILAADSRKTIVDSAGISKKGTTKKILHTNDYYYAISGLNSSDDRSFSLSAVIDRVLLRYDDFEDAVKHLAALLSTELKTFFINLRKGSLAVFRQFQSYSYSGGEIVIAKRVDKIPTIYLLDYKIIDGPDINVVINTWTTDIKKIKNGQECFWRAIGNTSFLNCKMPTEQEMAVSSIEKAKWIIEEGSRMYPDFVSEPINIIELTEGGDKWVLSSQSCTSYS
jgi:hypothetical protein